MKLLAIIPVILLTACAQVGSYITSPLRSSTDLAIEECSKIYNRNSSQFGPCVERTANSIRANRAAAASKSTETVCQPWLNGVRCVSQ